MSFSLIAIGDVHFDAPSLLGGDERQKVEKLKKEAFTKAVDEAVSRNINALFICGDLFDENAVSFETLIFLRKHFLRLASCGIKVLYAHGKSDPGAAPQLIRTNNLIDFSHETERYEVASDTGPAAVVYAAGFSNNPAFLADRFEEKSTNYPTVGMMYVSDGFSNQGSFILDGLSNLNYDLFILGGYHQYIVARGEKNIIYPGSPTGTWFSDKAGGALLAEINDYGRTALDKIELSDVSWHDIEMQNISETDIGTLKRKLETEIQSAVANTKDAFIRVTLSGRCFLADRLTDEVLDDMKSELSNTMDISVHIEKKNLLPMLPKTLLDSTSPFVESVKIIDTLKNDGDKFGKLSDMVQKKHELFYRTIPEDKKTKYDSDLKKGLLDTICKVMIKEDGHEN